MSLTVEHVFWNVRFYMEDEGNALEFGRSTQVAEGLFHTFVKKKTIEEGSPSLFKVRMSEEEARLFKLIVETQFWRKRSYWRDCLSKSPDKIHEELKEILPVWLLSRKLSVAK